jgi:hypothetical protein
MHFWVAEGIDIDRLGGRKSRAAEISIEISIAYHHAMPMNDMCQSPMTTTVDHIIHQQ